MQRRTFINHASSALAGAGATALGGANAREKEQRNPTFVFVHGAWHGAWCWAEVVRRLGKKGFSAIALDMPGHGLAARFPAAYASQDAAALATEVSPLAGLSTNDYRDYVLEVLRGLVAAGSGPIILVGHSLGGATLTAVAEADPRLIGRLVYVSAFVPVKRPAPVNYASLPSFAGSQLGSLLAGDPHVVACMRINFNTTNPAKAAAIKEALCADLSDAEFSAVANLLTPDEPIGAFATPVNPTAAKWGSVPRTFIRCTLDRAIPIAGQDQMIAEADEFTSPNKFVKETLDTSHSPHFSVPEALVSLLAKAAVVR